jgi:cytochrome c551/c552
MKCGACGDPNHDCSTCKAPDVDVLRWTLAKRKHIAEKYAGQPPPTAHLNDVPTDMGSVENAAEGDALEYDM